MKALSTFSLLLFLLVSTLTKAQTNYAALVNPFIGTGGHGHTFPGPVMPFGMVQLSPDTRVDGSWDGCSGYHVSDNFMFGFSHTHLSGTGCSDYGDILLMPMLGKPSMDNKIYGSKFNHKSEKASAGFYEVLLDDDKIKAELTVSPRLGIHRYNFPKSTEANVILDLLHRDKTLNCEVIIVDSMTVCGFRLSEAWAREQYVFYVIRFSKPFLRYELANKGVFKGKSLASTERSEGAYFAFNTIDGLPLTVKVALSSTSIDGAFRNMKAEGSPDNFDDYKKGAEKTWNAQLQKIEITDPDKDKLTTFYTALYHCCIHPSLNMDVDHQYRGRDNLVHKADGFTNYSVFSLWDTYRALHPLLSILEPKRTSDFMNTFLVQYEQSGRLPVWELSGNETDCMIGFHSVPVIADAMLKGIKGINEDKIFAAVKAASTYTRFSIPTFNRNNYLQVDDESESVSKSLEYAYDNWCIARLAQHLNKNNEIVEYLKRAQSYKNLFDYQSGCMRPRKNGNWLSPFYPSEINNHFTEGNSWQYSFAVPQDISGLIQLHGGKDKFEKKLDELFTTSEKTRGREQADVTGLIGQYAHGNEPSHHMAYLYSYVGKPQKTIQRVRQICNNFYKNSPDGLIGNEDCGQMSAWYVFSALGFYPVCPASNEYVWADPLFNKAIIHLDNGTSLSINSNRSGAEAVAGITINGKTTLRSALDHKTILAGGKIDFIYTNPANTANKYGQTEMPSSLINTYPIVPAALIHSASQVFKDKMDISIEIINQALADCYYTVNGTEPSRRSMPYAKPFVIDSNCTVKVKLYAGSDSSSIIVAHFYKIKYNYDIQILSTPNAQYAAEGAQTLIDGIKGDVNWRKGNWLGYKGQDFDCVIDLKEVKEISSMSLGCLQDSRSWILLPSRVNFYTSEDGKTFNLIDGVDSKLEAQNDDVQIQRFEKQFSKKITTRYLKVIAKNYGKLPDWHQGKGGEAFIFVDELELK